MGHLANKGGFWVVVGLMLLLPLGYLFAGAPVGPGINEKDDPSGDTAPAAPATEKIPQSEESGSGVRSSAVMTSPLGLVWARKTDMPTSRYGLGLAAGTNGKTYAIGGANPVGLATMEEYDPITNQWVSRSSMGMPRVAPGAIGASNGKIYAMGGESGASYLASVEEYTPATDSWVYRAKMPTARSGLGLVESGGKLFAIGGQEASGHISGAVEEYDLATNSWRTRTSLASPRAVTGIGGGGGKIYLVGGRDSRTKAALAAVDVYDIATDRWSAAPDIPTPRSSPAVVLAADGRLYVIGGCDFQSNTFLSNVEKYDPFTNSWSTLPQAPDLRGTSSAVLDVNGKVYLGGINSSVFSNGESTFLEAAPVQSRLELPYVAKSYRNPIVDDFASISSGWPTDEGDIHWRGYDAGEYRVLVKQSNYITRADMGSSAGDFQVLVDARASGSVNGAYGFYFGFGDAGYYAYQLYNGRFMLRRFDRVGQKWTTIVSQTWHSAILGGNATNRLKVDRRGPNISLYVNGQRVAQATDGTLGEGFVGLAASAYQDGFEARFDNFVLDFSSAQSLPSATPTPTPTRTATPSPTSTPTRVPMTWTARASMPTQRSSLGAAAATNGKIYVAGGSSQSGYMAAFEEYSPAANTWRSLAPMSTARAGLALVGASSGKIYAVGGWGKQVDCPWGWSCLGTPLDLVEEYDPDTDIWKRVADLPSPRAALTAVEVDGKLYAIGGSGPPTGTLDEVVEYDPTTNIWRSRGSLPTPRWGLAAAASNGRIYVIAGTTSGGASNVVEEYSPTDDVWISRANMPESTQSLVATTGSNGRVYAFGWSSSIVAEYDPGTNKWASTYPSLPLPTSSGAIATKGGKLYSIGGTTSNGVTGTVLETTTP